MEQYLGTAYTVKALLEFLNKIPSNAYMNLAPVLTAAAFNYVEIWYDEQTNIAIFK